jgi:hypothetical protein
MMQFVDLLLKAGPHVDIADDASRTATIRWHCCLRTGPNLTLLDDSARTALDFSFQFGENERVSQNLLLRAAVKRHLDRVTYHVS